MRRLTFCMQFTIGQFRSDHLGIDFTPGAEFIGAYQEAAKHFNVVRARTAHLRLCINNKRVSTLEVQMYPTVF